MKIGMVWQVQMDSRRRPTLPPDLLAAAGISPTDRLNARVDGEGRIILETPAAALARARALVRQGRMPAGSVVDELIEERRAEAEAEWGDDVVGAQARAL